MKIKKQRLLFGLVFTIIGLFLACENYAKKDSYKSTTTDPAMAVDVKDTGDITIGKFAGQVVYDSEKELYFLELRGARLPFKTSPIEALKVKLQAPGKNDKEKNSALLLGLLGKDVLHTTILINPDEENEIEPAVSDLMLYLQMVNPRKVAGLAYTKPGGKLKQSTIKGPQIQSFEDASAQETIVLIKGPKFGAKETVVRVLGEGRFVIEGRTYEDVYKAADFVCMTLIKMLCGSPDCPDASACTTGGDCGC